LIAGGLGERLGYSGIKIDLPVTIVHPNYSYINFYIKYVNACCERALKIDPSLNPDTFYVPFCIMTSDDTYKPTIDLLEKNGYFGYKKEQIDIIKQENVPALIDNNARIALNTDKTKIITKPHGHGDVHNLLF
jgi:UDP-sugar pyrophosphorylase